MVQSRSNQGPIKAHKARVVKPSTQEQEEAPAS